VGETGEIELFDDQGGPTFRSDPFA
jgi:hypothetical protein